MTVERIERRFAELSAQGKTALVAYLTVGDPSVEDSLACARAALAAGADILELGVPFSDPTADGPVIAAASYRAIQNGGSLGAALELARALRAESDAPLVLMTYYNPILALGDETTVLRTSEVGADGLLVVDLPPEEGAILRAAARRERIAIIPMVAPTTGLEREPRVLGGASGFVYYVSVTGVTGTGAAPLAEAGKDASALRRRAGLPVVVGFGVRTPENARTVAAQGVDGVVVGTELVRAISSAPDRAGRVGAVSKLIRALRQALDAR
jgi:tryptophan synthase alpha chain